MKYRTALLFALLLPLSVSAEEVYLSKDDALRLVLGDNCEKQYDPKPLTPAIIEQLKVSHLVSDTTAASHKSAHFFTCSHEGAISGYALIDSEVGKHLPITYIVGISPQGVVTRVEMMVFREIRGWEARERRFMQQFEGSSVKSQLEIGSGIKNVTGATLSSRAVAKGVKRALFLWNYFYGTDAVSRANKDQ